jgi:hypothetical protein
MFTCCGALSVTGRKLAEAVYAVTLASSGVLHRCSAAAVALLGSKNAYARSGGACCGAV